MSCYRCESDGRPAKSELDHVAGQKRFSSDSDTGDSVHSVASKQTSIVDDEEDQATALGSSQRIRLDDPGTPSTLLGSIVDVDLEAVRPGKSDQFKRRTLAPRHHDWRCSPSLISRLRSQLGPSKSRKRQALVDPGENVVERGPELRDRRQRGKLMFEHLVPVLLHLGAKR